MADVALNPYIFFRGDCEEAMNFYKDIFSGELALMKYKDAQGNFPGKSDMADKIMHASLKGGIVDLLGSDTQLASAESKKVDLCLGGSNEATMRKIFEDLSEGGTVNTPLKKEFWGDIFGQVVDKFGVSWMMNISAS